MAAGLVLLPVRGALRPKTSMKMGEFDIRTPLH
jgi:hypothetical protein